jgi:hypothetical protein
VTLKGKPSRLVAECLGEIGIVKGYRDAVIHVDIHAPKAKMARTTIKSGKPYEVDLSLKTLRALVRRIQFLQREMVTAATVIEHHFNEIDLEMNNYPGPESITKGRFLRRKMRDLLRYRQRRVSLPAIPKLREERSTREPNKRLSADEVAEQMVKTSPQVRDGEAH